MVEGIIWAVLAVLVLGLYALPEKYTKDFKTPAFTKNLGLILVMTVFHFAATALFAYSAFK